MTTKKRQLLRQLIEDFRCAQRPAMSPRRFVTVLSNKEAATYRLGDVQSEACGPNEVTAKVRVFRVSGKASYRGAITDWSVAECLLAESDAPSDSQSDAPLPLLISDESVEQHWAFSTDYFGLSHSVSHWLEKPSREIWKRRPSLISLPETRAGRALGLLESVPEKSDNALKLSAILALLSDSALTLESRVKLIHAAELLPVSKDLEQRFLVQWKEFIEQHRDTQNAHVLMAVACAIRKYVAVMPAAELSEVTFLLESGHSAEVPLELEVTVSKMIVRKLTANPTVADNPWPSLTRKLDGLIDDYLRDRQLPRRFIGAVALNTCLAKVMLRAPGASTMLETLKSLKSRWFVESFSDSAEGVMGEIIARKPAEASGPTVGALRSAVEFLGVRSNLGAQEHACSAS